MKKISELNSNEGLDVLVELTPLVKSLASHKSLISQFKALAEIPEADRTAPTFEADIMARLIPVWYKDCRDDILAIIGVMNGMTAEEVNAKGALWVLEETGALFSDVDFIGFFRSFVVVAPTE